MILQWLFRRLLDSASTMAIECIVWSDRSIGNHRIERIIQLATTTKWTLPHHEACRRSTQRGSSDRGRFEFDRTSHTTDSTRAQVGFRTDRRCDRRCDGSVLGVPRGGERCKLASQYEEINSHDGLCVAFRIFEFSWLLKQHSYHYNYSSYSSILKHN